MAWPTAAKDRGPCRSSRVLSVPIILAGLFVALTACAPQTPREIPVEDAAWFIDLIDEGVAVLIDSRGTLAVVPVGLLPAGAREGMVFDAPDTAPGGTPDCSSGRCTLNAGLAQAENARLAERRDRLLAGDEGGTIRL